MRTADSAWFRWPTECMAIVSKVTNQREQLWVGVEEGNNDTDFS